MWGRSCSTFRKVLRPFPKRLRAPLSALGHKGPTQRAGGGQVERRWIEAATRTAGAVIGNGAWMGAMTMGAFAVALAGERVLTLTLG